MIDRPDAEQILAAMADTLTHEDCAEYEARAERELGAACAHWLANGASPRQH